jgi:hypothetical protein
MKKDTRIILALFSKSPYALQPWADAGWDCWNFDRDADCGFHHGQNFDAFRLDHGPKALIDTFREWGVRPALIVSFPPCDDLAVCGAKHFKKKRRHDPKFQQKALALFRLGERLASHYECPCLTENPVSMAATLYRKPEMYISPHMYGGYLPKNDIHPEYPSYIAPRDAYRKTTCYWLKNGMLLAPQKPVALYDNGVSTALGRAGNSTQFLKLGGRSEKTKTIRALTPRSPFMALFRKMEGVISQAWS